MFTAATERAALAPIEPIGLRGRVYTSLLNAIVSGEMPPGLRIRDHDLAARLGVSRTPVREALHQLEADGLVETRPRALTRVTRLDPARARDVFPVLGALHGLAARLAVPVLEDTHVQEMRRHNRDVERARKRGALIDVVEADSRFHGVLVRASENLELAVLLDRLTPTARRFQFILFRGASVRTPHTHVEIVRACERRDVGEAAALSEQNWMDLGARVLRMLEDRADEDARAPSATRRE